MIPATQCVSGRLRFWASRDCKLPITGLWQGFPEAMAAADDVRKKNPDFKLIYGCEAYFCRPTWFDVVYGDAKASLHDSFISFDIETTGLSPKKGSDHRDRRGAD